MGAPSRTVLMTGKHMGHTTIRGNDGACELPAALTLLAAALPDPSRCASDTPLLPTDVTVAKVLQPTHVTGLIGKWGKKEGYGEATVPVGGIAYYISPPRSMMEAGWRSRTPS